MQHSAARRPRNVANPANTVYEDSCLHEFGGAIYVVERVFTGHRTAKQAVVEAVSYTHLDVYKRQPLNTVDGKLGSYVGNDTEGYSDLEFWSFADGSEYDWFDYVSGEHYTLKLTDEYTKLAVPYEYSVRCFAA